MSSGPGSLSNLPFNGATGRATRADAFPDGVNFTDSGCTAHPSCLSCPEPICTFDLPPQQRPGTAKHDHLMRLLAIGIAEPVSSVMKRFDLQRRQAFRLKAQAKALRARPSQVSPNQAPTS